MGCLGAPPPPTPIPTRTPDRPRLFPAKQPPPPVRFPTERRMFHVKHTQHTHPTNGTKPSDER
jgi:hypothetical protein